MNHMTPRKRNAKPCPHKKTTTTNGLTDGRQPHHRQSIHSARRRDKSSRCRATRVSAPSRSLPKLRDRTVLSPSGFVSGPVTPSDTTPSVGTGASPVSESKFVFWNHTPTDFFDSAPRNVSVHLLSRGKMFRSVAVIPPPTTLVCRYCSR